MASSVSANHFMAFLFILLVSLCVKNLANGQILPAEQHSFTDSYQKPAFDDPLSRNHSYGHQMKISLVGTDQMQNSDPPSGSMADRKTLTVWMKSLVLNGRGLIVFGSNGKPIYRVDIYKKKFSKEVIILDLFGEIVFTIRPKNEEVRYITWEGYKGSTSDNLNDKRPSFYVKEHRSHRIFPWKSSNCEVISDTHYSFEPCSISKSSQSNLEFKILNTERKTIAELKQMLSRDGISPKADLFSLVVEREADISFVVALVAVFCQINGQV